MTKRVFTIAPGAPFLRTFAHALLDGSLIEGYSKNLPPLELAQATIYVPTRRAARALSDELARAAGRPAMLLPRILPLGALEETEAEADLLTGESASEAASGLLLPAPASEIERRMRLSALIIAWSCALQETIAKPDVAGTNERTQGETSPVASTSADTWYLSGALASLIDELIINDVKWEKLDFRALTGSLPDLDGYWETTLGFLDIAIKSWPDILAGENLSDKSRREVALIDAQVRHLRDGPRNGPIIAIGSTGTNSATARLLAAIAGAPRGAIVLPGLDTGLDGRAWAMLEHGVRRNSGDVFTHPQAALCRLLDTLEIRRDEVTSLGSIMPELASRTKFVSQAMRPAETTDEWLNYHRTADQNELKQALDGVALIEAADEREEALALAIAMREVIESKDETAALVTPDRRLACRVRAELLRFGLEADDSAGEPLSNLSAGTLARLAIDGVAAGLTAPDIAALLAHPLLRLGLPAGEMARRAPLVEIGVLRSSCAAGPLAQTIVEDPSALVAQARMDAKDRFAHPARQRITGAQWAAIEDLMLRLGRGLAPLANLSGEHGLKQWVTAHRETTEAITHPFDDRTQVSGREALRELLDELEHHASPRMALTADAYARFFATVAREVIIRAPEQVHSGLQILGLLEARLIDTSVVLLGGLDETVWPPQAHTGAFLNRAMRAALGLSPPERKLGQTAHDFTQAMGKRKVIISRARKRDGTPAVASRFVQRLAALGGDSWNACRLRGKVYLDLARAIDRPAETLPTKRPCPAPPLELRPTALSVTQIETLRRDPYAIYAEKILRLKTLEPLGGEAGAGAKGNAIHRALERFADHFPLGPLPHDAGEKLYQLLREGLAAQLREAHFAALEWPQIEAMIGFFLAFEAQRRTTLKELMVEREGKLDIGLADGSSFTLTARADRIELHADGRVTLIDYKTGSVPETAGIRHGFSPQLTLEAAMALRGAFALPPGISSIEGLYVKLGGREGGALKPVTFDRGKTGFMDVAQVHFEGLIGLLNQFRNPAKSYPPRPFPKFAKRHNPYDHLARVMEWSRGAPDDGRSG